MGMEQVKRLLSMTMNEFDADYAVVGLSRRNDQELLLGVFLRSEWAFDWLQLCAGKTYCNQVINENRVVAISNIQDGRGYDPCSFMRADGMIAFIGAPMCVPKEYPWGVVSMMDRRERNWTIGQHSHIASCASQVSRALARTFTSPVSPALV